MLAGHMRQKVNSGCLGFNLKTNYMLKIKEQPKNKCAGCSVDMLWDYGPKEFSIDRLNNSKVC